MTSLKSCRDFRWVVISVFLRYSPTFEHRRVCARARTIGSKFFFAAMPFLTRTLVHSSLMDRKNSTPIKTCVTNITISARKRTITIFRVYRHTELNRLDTDAIPVDEVSSKLTRLTNNFDTFRIFEGYKSFELLNANLSQFELSARFTGRR